MSFTEICLKDQNLLSDQSLIKFCFVDINLKLEQLCYHLWSLLKNVFLNIALFGSPMEL